MALFQAVEFVLTLEANCSELTPSRVLKGSQVTFCFLFGHTVACGILVPRPGLEPKCRALESGLLTTGPLGSPEELGSQGSLGQAWAPAS